MSHLTDEQLVEHYFHEDVNRAATTAHLYICSRCEQAYEEISNSLGVRGPEPPACPPGFGESVWKSIQGPLRPYSIRQRSSFFSMPRLAFAGACLVALVVAFVGGIAWEKRQTTSPVAANPSQAKERVALLILADHLDRSERLLVELNHAGTESGMSQAALQAEARQLLADNRVYRQAFSGESDPILAGALDHLERVLLEAANSSDDLSNDNFTNIEQEMNTDSLLFQIRVLRARVSRDQPKARSSQKGEPI